MNTSRAASELRARVRDSFNDFAQKRIDTDDPRFLTRNYKHGLRKAWLLWLSGPFRMSWGGGRGKRMLFLSSRYGELLARSNRDSVVVLGGPSDRRAARALGMAFRATADLFLGGFASVFGTPPASSGATFSRWIAYLSRQADPCYLLVANDTMPMALMLVMAARECPNVRIVCIQHGLLSAGPVYQFDDVEGRNSHINLVFTPKQRLEMERRLGGGVVECMGLPSDARCEPSAQCNAATLVGTGTLGNSAEYERSLELFEAVRNQLKQVGIRATYRPHPSEHGLGTADCRFDMDGCRKETILRGPRRLFIGFASTLLYEADVAGHIVVVLDDEQIPGYPLRDFGTPFDTRGLNGFGAFALAAIGRQLPPTPPREHCLNRLEAALSRAEKRLERAQLS